MYIDRSTAHCQKKIWILRDIRTCNNHGTQPSKGIRYRLNDMIHEHKTIPHRKLNDQTKWNCNRYNALERSMAKLLGILNRVLSWYWEAGRYWEAGTWAYAALQSTLLPYQAFQLNRDSDSVVVVLFFLFLYVCFFLCVCVCVCVCACVRACVFCFFTSVFCFCCILFVCLLFLVHKLVLTELNTIRNEPGTAFPIKLHVRPAKSDQSSYMRSLVRIFAWHSVGNQGSKASLGGKRTLWSTWLVRVFASHLVTLVTCSSEALLDTHAISQEMLCPGSKVFKHHWHCLICSKLKTKHSTLLIKYIR